MEDGVTPKLVLSFSAIANAGPPRRLQENKQPSLSVVIVTTITIPYFVRALYSFNKYFNSLSSQKF